MPAGARFAIRLALLTSFVLGLFAVVAVALWTGLDPGQRATLRDVLQAKLSLLAALALLLPFLLGGLLRWWMGAYPLAAASMTEEVAQVQAGSGGRRVTLAGAAPMRQLGDAVNGLVEVHDRLRSQVQRRVEEARQQVEEERGRLAALMSELAHGVIVCDRDGRILLHNDLALQLLDGAEAGPHAAPARGHSIYGLLDKSQVLHALDRIGHRLDQHAARPMAQFVASRGERLLRVQMAPVPDAQLEVGGFVAVLDDITRSVESDSRRERLLRQLTEGTRASLANLRAAVETLQQYPDMEADRRRRFMEMMREESRQMSLRLDAAVAAAAEIPGTPWPLEDMPAADLANALQRSIERRLGVTAAARNDGQGPWLSVDSHALVQALTRIAARLTERFGVRSVIVETAAAGRFVQLALCWSGPALDAELLRRWQDEPCADGDAATLDELLSRHGAEIWSVADRAQGVGRVCLQFPAGQLAQATP